MPLPAEQFRICVYGDSHLGSVRLAQDAGLISWPDGAEVEFWGATGPWFRQIRWADGAIRATGDALQRVTQINDKRRDHLKPDDFDLFIFYGARLRVAQYMAPMHDWFLDKGTWPSAAVMQKSAAHYLNCVRSFRIAREIARAGGLALCLPAPFPTDGVVDLSKKNFFLDNHPRATDARAESLQVLWGFLIKAAAADGVKLIPQPAGTITRGMLTKGEFACDDAIATKDAGHKRPDFAALWINDVLKTLFSNRVSTAA